MGKSVYRQYLSFLEEIWKILHGVGSDAGNVGILPGILSSKGFDSILYIV